MGEAHGKARERHRDRERGRGRRDSGGRKKRPLGDLIQPRPFPRKMQIKAKVLVLPVLEYRFSSAPWGGSQDFSVYCWKTW